MVRAGTPGLTITTSSPVSALLCGVIEDRSTRAVASATAARAAALCEAGSGRSDGRAKQGISERHDEAGGQHVRVVPGVGTEPAGLVVEEAEPRVLQLDEDRLVEAD